MQSQYSQVCLVYMLCTALLLRLLLSLISHSGFGFKSVESLIGMVI